MGSTRSGGFWVRELPPLDGRVRFIVVAGIALLGWNHFHEIMPARLSTCPVGFFEPMGLMQWIPLSENPGQEAGAFIQESAPLLLLLLVCGALGIGNGWAMLASGLLLASFVGLHRSCTGTGHMWYLPMYTLIALGAACRSDEWSLDAWLARKFPGYPLYETKSGGIRSTGFGPQLVLLFSVFMLFSAGVAKLAEAGPIWATGESLQAYLRLIGAPKPWGKWLSDLLLASDVMAGLAATFTLVLELGSVVMLFVRRSRLPFVIAAWGFHLGIMAVMLPEYLPQMLCYLVFLDVTSWRKHASEKKASRKVRQRASQARQRAALLGAFVSVSLAVTMVLRIDSFPLSHVPMYSSRLGEGYIAGHPAADWGRPESVQRIARQLTEDRRPWFAKFGLSRFLQIYGVESPRHRPQLLTPMLASKIAPGDPALWSSRLSLAAARDLAQAPLTPGARAPLVEGGAAEEFLADVAQELRPKTDRPLSGILALVYVFPDGRSSVIGRLQLR